MGSPKSVTTDNPEPRRKDGASFSKGTPMAVTAGIEAANSDDKQSSRGPRPSEVPPTGLLTGMLGEMAFCYGACWRHYRSAQR